MDSFTHKQASVVEASERSGDVLMTERAQGATSVTERVELEAGEEILLVVRKHWFVLFREIIIPILLFIIPVGFYLFADSRVLALEVFLKIPNKEAAVLFFISVWGIITWMMLFLVWTDYYLDMWTITN
jgi:hypothetical protein